MVVLLCVESFATHRKESDGHEQSQARCRGNGVATRFSPSSEKQVKSAFLEQSADLTVSLDRVLLPHDVCSVAHVVAKPHSAATSFP
jgi:hypothetical protein